MKNQGKGFIKLINAFIYGIIVGLIIGFLVMYFFLKSIY